MKSSDFRKTLFSVKMIRLHFFGKAPLTFVAIDWENPTSKMVLLKRKEIKTILV